MPLRVGDANPMSLCTGEDTIPASEPNSSDDSSIENVSLASSDWGSSSGAIFRLLRPPGVSFSSDIS